MADPFNDLFGSPSAQPSDPFNDLFGTAPEPRSKPGQLLPDSWDHRSQAQTPTARAFEPTETKTDSVMRQADRDPMASRRGDPQRDMTPDDSWRTLGRKFVENLDETLLKLPAAGVLQSVGQAEADVVTGAVGSMAGLGFGKLVGDAVRPYLERANEPIANIGREIGGSARAELERNAPEFGPDGQNTVKRYAYDIANGFVQMGSALGASVITRSPTVGATIMGAQVFGEQVDDSLRKGRTPQEALRDGVFMGAVELVSERIPLAELMKPGGRFLAKVGKGAAVEGIQEMVTETLQTAYDAGVIGEEMTWGQAVRQILDSGIIGSAVGGTLGAASYPFTREKPDIFEQSRGKQPEPGKTYSKADAVFELGLTDAEADQFVATGKMPDVSRPAGVVQQAETGMVDLTQDDIDSALPTDLIAEGKLAMGAADAQSTANGALKQSGMPNVGTRVSVEHNGVSKAGVVADAWEASIAGQTSTGVKIKLDDGSTIDESVDTLRDMGVSVLPEGLPEGDLADPVVQGFAGKGMATVRQTLDTAADAALNDALTPAVDVNAPNTSAVDVNETPVREQQTSAKGRRTDFADYTRKMERVESGGKLTAKNPNSSAEGPYQFIDSTWAALGGDPNKRTDRAENNRIIEKLNRQNAAALEKAGYAATDGNLYLAHFLGSAGAKKALSNPNAPVPEAVQKANPFAKGWTNARLAAWADRKMGGKGDTPANHAAGRFWRSEDSHVDAEPLTLAEEAYEDESRDEPAPDALSLFKEANGSSAGPDTETRTAIAEQVAQVAEPTEAQKEAGNYKHGHVRLHGFDISIENGKGSTRRGTDAKGRPWETVLPAHYGYVKGTEGADGDHVDVYIGPKPESTRAFVVDQFDPNTAKFDETKTVLGVETRAEALAIYDAGFSDGSGPKRRGSVTEMSVEEFRDYATTAAKKPAGETSLLKARALAKEAGENVDFAYDKAQGEQDAGISGVAADQGALSAADASRLSELRGNGDNSASGVGDRLPRVSGAPGAASDAATFGGQDRRQEGLRAGERPVGDQGGASAEPTSVRTSSDLSRPDNDGSGVGAGSRNTSADDLQSTGARNGAGSGTRSEAASEGSAAPASDARRGDASPESMGSQSGAQSNDASGAAEAGLDSGAGANQRPVKIDALKAKLAEKRRPKPKSGKPVSVIAFVRKIGGIRDNEGHDLSKGRGLRRHPGLINNKSGRSIDEVGEALWEAGYIGTPDQRPTTAEVLELLDNSDFKPTYKPSETLDADENEQQSAREAEEEAIREELRGVAAEGQLDLTEDEIDAAMFYRAEGASPWEALDRIVRESAALFLAEVAQDSKSRYDYADVADQIFAGEHAEARGSADESGGRPDDLRREAGGSQAPAGEPAQAPPAEEPPAASPEAAEGAESLASNDADSSDGQLDAFGERPADQRRALERQAEGRLRSDKTQKAPGSDGGLFDVQDSTGDFLASDVVPPRAGLDPLYDDQDTSRQIGWFDPATGAVERLSGGPTAPRASVGSDPDTEVAATLSGNELGDHPDTIAGFRELRASAVKWYRNNLVGKTATTSDGRTVQFDEVGLRKSTSRKGESLLRSVPAIRDIIERGELLTSEPGDRRNVKAIHFYAASVSVGGKVLRLGAHIREMADGSHHYNLTFDNRSVGSRPTAGGEDAKASVAPALEGSPDELNLVLVDESINAEALPRIEIDTAAVKKLQDRLLQRLAMMGIKDRISLEVGHSLRNLVDPSWQGQYDPWLKIISISLANSRDPEHTFDHEALHAFRDLEGFTPEEWGALVAEAWSDPRLRSWVQRHYSDLDLDRQQEEAVAEWYAEHRDFAAGRIKGTKTPPIVQRALYRFVRFIRAVQHAASFLLKGKPADLVAFDVALRMESGAIGARVSAPRTVRGRPVTVTFGKKMLGEAQTAPPNAAPAKRQALLASSAFWGWFGDSKVVDEAGKPLVMYHGTSRDQRGDAFTMFDTYASNYGLMGMGGYFTADPEIASSYSKKGRGQSPTVYPVYLSIKNPIDMDAKADPAKWMAQFDGGEDYHEGGETNESWYRAAEELFMAEELPMYEGAEAMQDGLRNMGHDGITHMGGGRVHADGPRHRVYVAFDPEQIKSATGNNGNFDPESVDIRASVAAGPNDSIPSPLGRSIDDPAGAGPRLVAPVRMLLDSVGPSGSSQRVGEAIDRFRAVVQDRMLPVLRVQARVERMLGRAITEEENPYLGEELMSGRVGARLELLTDQHVEPLFEQMRDEGVTADELQTFLYARHAKERNARIASINPEFSEGEGSGMTDAEAGAIMAEVDAQGRREPLERLAARVDDLLAFALNTRVEAGLLSPEEAQVWRKQYQHYVPLRGRGADARQDAAVERVNRQSGISVKGKESRRAFGRKSRAADILAYSILQAEEAVVRAETNRVGQQFLELAKAAPDADFWKVDKIRRVPVFNKASGEVSYRNERRIAAEDAPYTVSVKVEGTEHRVTMNRDNPAAVRVADAMRNLSAQQFGMVVRTFGAINRFLSAVNTSYSPEFVITNALRDLQSATINLTGEQVKGLVSGVLKDYPGALKAATKGAFGKGSGEWDRWYQEFKLDGGRTYFNHVDDMNDLKKRVEQAAKLAQSRFGAKRMLFAVRDVIENVNGGVENALRLATYKNARQAGVSRKVAASLAKNVTVNFNRKGSAGPFINSFYMFFNASMQGSTRIFLAMRSKKVQGVLVGTVVAGFLLQLLNSAWSDDDEDGEKFYNKIPEFEKQRNLIVMLPGQGGQYVKVPLPWGYNVFPNLGRTLAQLYQGERPTTAIGNWATSVLEAFNPIGGAQSLLNVIAPTVVDPIVDLVKNRDYADRPIMPDEKQFGPQDPDAQRYWGSVPTYWKAVTDFLTEATGGDEVQPGAIDVSPETLDFLQQVVFGAAGNFVRNNMDLVSKLVTDDPEAEIERNDLPFVRRVVGDKPTWYDKAAFYTRLSEVEQAVDYGKKYIKAGDMDGFDNLVESSGDVLDLEKSAKAARKIMRKVRKERRELEVYEKKGEVDEASVKIATGLLDAKEQEVITDFNRVYLEVVKQPTRP